MFEFTDPNSLVFVKYRESLGYILESGTKVVFMGSMQDQVVPLYSAVMSTVHHPNILRSVCMDDDDDAFLSALVVFALILHNRGLSDHQLLAHMSSQLLHPFNNSQPQLYEDPKVYMTAVRYMFDTTEPFGNLERIFVANKNKTRMDHQVMSTKNQQENPFYLPWILHAIFTDTAILADDTLRHELTQLLSLFELWNPKSYRLKELKYRLDPLSSLN